MLHPVAEQPFLSPGETMMEKMQFGKRVGLPAQHVRLDFIDRVPSRSGPEAPDCLPSGLFVNLRRTSDMEPRIRLEFQPSRNAMVNLPSADSKAQNLEQSVRSISRNNPEEKVKSPSSFTRKSQF